MSTLDGSIWSRCSIALTCPGRSHFQRTQSRERRTGVGINVTAYQEKKNEETKTGRRKRKQVTGFKEAVCCPSAVVQGVA